MPTPNENIEYISKAKFFQESNITNMLISNLFNVRFRFSTGDNDVVKNDKLLNTLLQTTTLNKLEFNVANIRLPSISTDYDTFYFNNNRYYTTYRDNSDILTLGFFEDASFNIRRFFKDWISLTTANEKNIIDSNTLLPIMLYPYEYDCKDLTVFPINGKYESNAMEVYERIHPITIEDKTFSFTEDVSVPIVAVSFVYKKYYPFKIDL